MKITYNDKTSLIDSPLPDENKVTDDDMNEIKVVVNVNETPIGSGMEYFGTTLPDNYLWADGSAVSRTDYAELFAVIGTMYGVGDGVDTFNVPDLRKRHPVMKADDETVGTTGGNSVLFAMVNPTGGGMNYQNSGRAFSTNYRTTGTGSKEASTQSNSNAGISIRGDVDSSSREAYLVVNYIIRYR